MSGARRKTAVLVDLLDAGLAERVTGRLRGDFADPLRALEPRGTLVFPEVDYAGLELRILAHGVLREAQLFTRGQPTMRLHALSTRELRLALILALGKEKR